MARERNKNTYEKMMMIYENTISMRREQMDIKKNWDETMSAVQTMMKRMDAVYDFIRTDYINVIDSIDAVYVETSNPEEEIFVMERKAEFKKLLRMIVRKEKAESNQLEWEMLRRYIMSDNGNMKNLKQELVIERNAKEDLEKSLSEEQEAKKKLEQSLSEEQEAKEKLEQSLSEEQEAKEELKQKFSEAQ